MYDWMEKVGPSLDGPEVRTEPHSSGLPPSPSFGGLLLDLGCGWLHLLPRLCFDLDPVCIGLQLALGLVLRPCAAPVTLGGGWGGPGRTGGGWRGPGRTLQTLV